MKVFIQTSLEVYGHEGRKQTMLGREKHYAIDQFKKLLLDAFNTQKDGHTDELPEPWMNESPLLCLDLENKARLIITDSGEPGTKETSHITLNVFIIGYEDDPTPKRCIKLFLKLVKQADKRSDCLRIQTCNVFNLYPINNGDIDDEQHYFIAKTDRNATPIALIVICILLAILFQALRNLLGWEFISTLVGIPIGMIATIVCQLLRSSHEITIDVDETMRKETESLKNKTQMNLEVYSEPVNVIRRSKDRGQ